MYFRSRSISATKSCLQNGQSFRRGWKSYSARRPIVRPRHPQRGRGLLRAPSHLFKPLYKCLTALRNVDSLTPCECVTWFSCYLQWCTTDVNSHTNIHLAATSWLGGWKKLLITKTVWYWYYINTFIKTSEALIHVRNILGLLLYELYVGELWKWAEHDEHDVVMLLGFCLHHLDAEGNWGESF